MRKIRLAFVYGILASSAAIMLLIGLTHSLELSADPSSLAAKVNFFSG